MYKKPLQVVFEYQDGRRVVATRDSQGNESPSFVFEAPSYWEEKFVWMYRRNSFDGPNMCDRERQRYQSQNWKEEDVRSDEMVLCSAEGQLRCYIIIFLI